MTDPTPHGLAQLPAETTAIQDLNASFLYAIENGLTQEAEKLADQVDWSSFSPENSPLEKLFMSYRWSQSEEKLCQLGREQVADAVFAAYNFCAYEVVEVDGWQTWLHELSRTIYFKDGHDEDGYEINFSATFAVDFESCSTELSDVTLSRLNRGQPFGSFDKDIGSFTRQCGVGCRKDEMPAFSLAVLGWCIQHGRTDLITQPYVTRNSLNQDPVSFRHPIFDCVFHRLPQGVLLCLETGANPDARVTNGHFSAKEAADTMGCHDISALIQSFCAKQSALAAIEELSMPLATSPVKLPSP